MFFYQRSGVWLPIILNSTLDSKNYEFTKFRENQYIKKYNDGRFEAYGKAVVEDFDFSNYQLGSTGIYYATYTNFLLGITALTIDSILIQTESTGVTWSITTRLSTNKQSLNGIVCKYGKGNIPITLYYNVRGTWK